MNKIAYVCFENPQFHYAHKEFAESVNAKFLKSEKYSSRFFFAKTFLKAFKNRNKYNTLLVIGGSGLVLSGFIKLLNPKVKMIYLNVDPLFYEIRKNSWLKKAYIKFLVDRIDGIISNSNLVNKYIQEMANCPSRIVYPFIQEKKFNFTASKNLNNLLYLGRLSPEKNIPLIIDSFKIVKQNNKQAKLFIVGDGMLRKKIESLKTDGVFLCGHDPNPEKYLSKCGILLQPSIFDSYSCSVIEAMASGSIPVLSSSVGAKEIVDNPDLVIKNLTPVTLAEKIISIQDLQKKKIKNLAKELKSKTRVLNKKSIIKKFKNAFEELLK